MPRGSPSRRAAAWAAVLGLVSAVAIAGPVPPSAARPTLSSLSSLLLGQLEAERAAIERAHATVHGKVGEQVQTNNARARAAYKVLRDDPPQLGEPPVARMNRARRAAAMRFVLRRGSDELALLVEERGQLEGARDQVVASMRQAMALPAALIALAWPVEGTVVRQFGRFEHERSRATLSRRGIDLEVARDALVTSPGAGVVRYVGPIRGLDLGVIVDHGSVMTVTAKLGSVSTHIGDTIAAGAQLGRASRTRIYLETRVNVGPGGIAVDPELLLPPR